LHQLPFLRRQTAEALFQKSQQINLNFVISGRVVDLLPLEEPVQERGAPASFALLVYYRAAGEYGQSTPEHGFRVEPPDVPRDAHESQLNRLSRQLLVATRHNEQIPQQSREIGRVKCAKRLLIASAHSSG
jgi:hypothetical protein